MAKDTKKEDVQETPIDKQAFIQRKLQTLNQKNGAKYERNAVRVVQNNQ